MANLPAPLATVLNDLLGAPPDHVQPVRGGDISQAARIAVGTRRYFAKWLTNPPATPTGWPDIFDAEARGLALLGASGGLRVPAVHAHAPVRDGSPAYIVMEWIEPANGANRPAAGRELGRRLAEQHRVTAPVYGLDHSNYCGTTPQPNDQSDSWIAFYGQRRLGFQANVADRRGRLPTERRRRLDRVIARLGEWIDEASVRPSLLHGDLWGGNWLIDAAGAPVLIDPAVYFGDREAELALCHLFGGFPEEFYRAYDAAWSPAPGRAERIPLYQLYHLLNHLNLFGEGYGSQVDAILRRYAG
jgi:fructosamine-3-kinase